MGWVAAVGAVLQVAAQRSAANAQQVQLTLQQRQEKAAATDRDVQRQRRLNAILGAQNAAIAASGIVNSGSVANVSLIDAKRAAEDSQVDRINTSAKITALRTESKAIRRVSNIQSAATLFQAAGRAYDRGMINKPRVSTGSANQAGSGLTGSTRGLA
ncbi:MAG TPA: hypothetical protein VM756_00155 [Burkholderiales bacterium]|nr:hypothetical protein [Burkholderiales bacterium]